ELAALKPDLETKIRSVRQWANTEHHRLQHLITQRQHQGFYRDGHGDLHLANLVRFEGHVMAFDALEFNADLRQIDIMGDIAFTFMDLLAFGRADLAWTLMNAWCEHTGDYAGLRLLRYYTLYRAVVRAKVAALSGNTSNNQRTLQRYWSLVGQLIAAPNPPRLVLLTGLSGSGKSTVAAELATHLSAIRLRADVIRKQLFTDEIKHPDRLYSAKATRATYAELARLTKILLAQNMTVIVDATFLSQTHVDRFDKLAKHFSIKIHILACHAPVPELRRRIDHRAKLGGDPSDATLAVLEQQLASQVSRPVQWPVPQNKLNTYRSIADMNRHIAKFAQLVLKS
ncbi:MAG TPA: AAA family ATPase, partial [Orrella sp.]